MTIFEELNTATNEINRLLLCLSPGDSPEENLFIDNAISASEKLDENIKHLKEAKGINYGNSIFGQY